MNLNRVFIAGNVGGEPTIRETGGGSKVANLRLAVSEFYTNRDGERQENTTWLDVSAFGKTAEFIEKYIGKGRNIFVEGRIRTRIYTNKDGVEVRVTEIAADNVQPLDRPKDDGGSWTADLLRNKGRRTAAPKTAAAARETIAKKQAAQLEPQDDDLPFVPSRARR